MSVTAAFDETADHDVHFDECENNQEKARELKAELSQGRLVKVSDDGHALLMKEPAGDCRASHNEMTNEMKE